MEQKSPSRRLRQRWAYIFKVSVWKPGYNGKSSEHEETKRLIERCGQGAFWSCAAQLFDVWEKSLDLRLLFHSDIKQNINFESRKRREKLYF